MENNKIISLLKVEIDILRHYDELCQRETMKRYDDSFTNLIGLLKLDIEKQNEILRTLTNGELLTADNACYKEYLKKSNIPVDVDKVMSRISVLCTNQFVENGVDGGYAILNKSQLQAKYIVMGEAVNIHLSFIDEYLSQIDDLSLRKELCTFKYFLIYVMGFTIENSLIECYYHIDKSIYLTSYLEASLKNIPIEYIDSSKREFANTTINSKQVALCKMLLSLTPEDVARYGLFGQDLLRASITFRSDLLLLNDSDYLDTLNKLRVSKDNPWYNIFLKDRSRHKIVTMGAGRTR